MSLIVNAGCLVIGGERVQVVPVGPQVTNVACLFLPSFVSNEALVQALSPYGKVLTVTSGLMSGRRGVLTGTRYVRMEMNAANPVPNYLRISGHRATFDYRGLQRVCRRCGSGDHLRAQCTTPYCGRCGVHGHVSEGCDRPCRRCGDGHPTVVCPVRRSYSDAAAGAFPPLTPATEPTTDSGDAEEVTDAVLASPLQVPSNEAHNESAIVDATLGASASPLVQEPCASKDATHCPENGVGVSSLTPLDVQCTNDPSYQAAAVGVGPTTPVILENSGENTTASSVAAAPTISTSRRTRKKSPTQRVPTPACRDVDSAASIKDVDPSLPAAQSLPPQDTSSEDGFSLGLDSSIGLSSLADFDVEMGAPRETKRGHTSSSCSDERSDGRGKSQRSKKPRPSSGGSNSAL